MKAKTKKEILLAAAEWMHKHPGCGSCSAIEQGYAKVMETFDLTDELVVLIRQYNKLFKPSANDCINAGFTPSLAFWGKVWAEQRDRFLTHREAAEKNVQNCRVLALLFFAAMQEDK